MQNTITNMSYASERSLLITAALGRQQKARSDLEKRPRTGEQIIRLLLLGAGLLSVFTTLFIVVFLGTEAVSFFQSHAWVHAKAVVTDATTGAVVEAPITLADAVNASATSLTIQQDYARQFEVGNIIRLDDEILKITAISAGTLTVERGQTDGATTSIARDHAAGTAIQSARQPKILEYLTGTKWQPQTGQFGILPLVEATLMTTLIALLVAVPVGLFAAIYLSEYASQKARGILNPVLEILVGVPTVVYGFFALQFVTQGVLQPLLGNGTVNIFNTLSAGIVVGIMIVPTIASMSVDAMGAVPRSLREASFGLGATKLETIVRVLLPASLSGIVAAVILGASRAIGETMIVAIAAGNGPNWTMLPNFFVGAETMTGHIVRISGGDLSYASVDYTSIFAIGMTLFIITLLLTQASTLITSRFREQYE